MIQSKQNYFLQLIHQIQEIFICLVKEQYVFFTSADYVLAQSALTYNVSNTFPNNLFI